MIILHEQEVHQQPRLLAEAWDRPATFALLPERLNITEDWLNQSLSLIPEELRRDHFIMLTSGTTGYPKIILGVRARAERLVEILHRRQQSQDVKETISVLPLSYSYAFVNQWLWSQVMGRRFVTTHGFTDPKSLKEILAAANDAMICMVGIQVPLLLRYLADASFPGVIRVHFAGGRFPQERLGELRALFPNALFFNNYGCAEAMPRLTLRPADACADAANIGHPLEGIQMRDTEDHAVLFRSPYGAVGFIDEMKFIPITPEDWIPSGDLGELQKDGSWRLLGRASEVFKRHGEKVSIAALTTTVTGIWPGQCAFYREVDPVGEDGCVLTISPAAAATDLKAILLALRNHHPRAHWPLRIECADQLPLLPNGKVDVRALPTLPAKTILWRQHI